MHRRHLGTPGPVFFAGVVILILLGLLGFCPGTSFAAILVLVPNSPFTVSDLRWLHRMRDPVLFRSVFTMFRIYKSKASLIFESVILKEIKE